eukprot:maker-scaffold_4-snap-gene-11.7-mRNA-1 protein AED:0.25 eAED:0.25 QI:21/1/1/1/0.5/0.66/3/103/323
MKILFIGNGKLAQGILPSILDHDISVIASAPKSFGKRKKLLKPTPIYQTASEFGLPLVEAPEGTKAEWKRWHSSLKQFEYNTFDLGIVTDFGGFVPSEMFKVCRHGFLNVHPSLLPRHRGASPIHHTILKDDVITGVSLLHLDPDTNQWDRGRVVGQDETKVLHNEFYDCLHSRLTKKGSTLLKAIVEDTSLNNQIRVLTNVNKDVEESYSRKVKKKNSFISWELDSTKYIFNKFRAFSENLGVHCRFKGKTVKICKMKAEKNKVIQNEVGQIDLYDNTLVVSALDGTLIIDRLQVEGKSEVSSAEFWNGYLQAINEKDRVFK